MSPSELQAYRKLLFLEISEAAPIIGKCSKRAWQYWESGRSATPEHVNKQLRQTLVFRSNLINKAKKDVENSSSDEVVVKWYKTFDAFLNDYPEQNELSWRVYQSVVVGLNSDFIGRVKLVEDGQVLPSINSIMNTFKPKKD